MDLQELSIRIACVEMAVAALIARAGMSEDVKRLLTQLREELEQAGGTPPIPGVDSLLQKLA